jgi:hypothetical protein
MAYRLGLACSAAAAGFPVSDCLYQIACIRLPVSDRLFRSQKLLPLTARHVAQPPVVAALYQPSRKPHVPSAMAHVVARPEYAVEKLSAVMSVSSRRNTAQFQ